MKPYQVDYVKPYTGDTHFLQHCQHTLQYHQLQRKTALLQGYRKLQNSTYSRLLSSGSDVPADVKVAANVPGDGSMADPAE